MGGQQGSRGYLYQGIVSIFSSFAEEDWNKISVEYTTANDKVDIAFLSNQESVLRAVQVKSSINLFTKENIISWLTDLMNDVSAKEYQLILIGNCQTSANNLIKSIDKFRSNTLDKEARKCLGTLDKQIIGKNIKILLLPFDESHLMGVIRDTLNRFISLQGYIIDYTSLEKLCYALLSLHMFLGTNGDAISKEAYVKRIMNWLMTSSNGSMNKNGVYSELKVKILDQSDESLSDNGCSIPFENMTSLLKYRNDILDEGKDLIQKIDAIKLSAFKQDKKSKPINPEEIQKYVNGDIHNLNFDDILEYRHSELLDNEKAEVTSSIKKYWDVVVSTDFFYVGNLTENTLLFSVTNQVDYNGTDNEKFKNNLLQELKWKISILDYIDYLIEILNNVHILPLCIINESDVSDKNITISFSTHSNDFRLFSLRAEISAENRELLDILADTLIEEKIIENILNIKPTAHINLESKKWTPPESFIIPDLFGRRRRYDFEDLIIEWEMYQAEESIDGIVTYEISSLRAGETKWLSPYIIIIPIAEKFSLEYTILSDSSGDKKSGVVNINPHFT